MEPLFQSRGEIDIYMDLCERAGILCGEGGYLDEVNKALKLNEEYRLPLDRKRTARDLRPLGQVGWHARGRGLLREEWRQGERLGCTDEALRLRCRPAVRGCQDRPSLEGRRPSRRVRGRPDYAWSNTSRTLRVSVSGVSGFNSTGVSLPNTPWRAISSSG